MASTTTANRADLVKALDEARMTAHAAIARMRAAQAEVERLAAEVEIANQNRLIAVNTLETVRATHQAQRLEVHTLELPPDPHAYQHRIELEYALKEKK